MAAADNEIPDPEDRALAVFRRHGGVLRTSDALASGVHPRTLYELRDAGLIEQLSRGVYRLADLPAMDAPDLATVALQVTGSVICLLSALAFHELTTQIPHEVYLTVREHEARPTLNCPPLRVF